MAEIEIGVLQRQCLARCAAEQTALAAEVAAWQRRRNASSMWDRVDVHPSRCRSEAQPPLCFVINVSTY